MCRVAFVKKSSENESNFRLPSIANYMLGLGFTKYNRTPTPHPTIRYALNKVKVYYSFIKISEIKWLSFCSAIFSMWPPTSRSSYDSEWLLQLQPSHLPSRKTAEKTEGPKGPHTFPFIEPLWQEPHPSSFYVSLVKSWSYGHIQLPWKLGSGTQQGSCMCDVNNYRGRRWLSCFYCRQCGGNCLTFLVSFLGKLFTECFCLPKILWLTQRGSKLFWHLD